MSCTNLCKQPKGRLEAHCSLCHVTFKSVAGFDRHRRGGTCALPQDVGMSVQGGVWS